MWRINNSYEISHEPLPIRLGAWQGSVRAEGAVKRLIWESDQQQKTESGCWHLEWAAVGGDRLRMSWELTWRGEQAVRLEQVVLKAGTCQLGQEKARWSFYKNGYQSWSESRAFQAEETERVSWLQPMNILQSNPRNPPKGETGAFTGEIFAILGNLDEQCFILLGQGAQREQFVYINAWLPNRHRKTAALELVFDFGGRVVNPGESVALDEVWGWAGSKPGILLSGYLEASATPRALYDRSPAGWCSWYYYYTKINAENIQENLTEVTHRNLDWQVFVIDDGYQAAVGDWLSINEKFPQGLAGLADQVRRCGLRAGLWLAPFVARGNSKLFREHPDWVLRDRKGKPQLAGWNPNWGLEGRFYGLDTTHPGFQNYLREVIRVIVNEWGFNYLKLDFVYGASLPGQAFDSRLTAAQRLSLGYQIIRETAGEEVFLLGCGSPFGPAQRWVDGMRIGPDVAPYWEDPLRTRWTRDPHALCTRTAIRSILGRSAFHRRWWFNDPDCLMLRENETKLSADERYTLAVAAAVTGGLLFFSDRLKQLPEETWEQMRQIRAIPRECDQYPAETIGFMEGEFPVAAWNPAGYLAVFNFDDHEKEMSVQVGDTLANGIQLWDVQSQREWEVQQGTIHVGILPAHSALLLSTYQKKH